MADTPRADEPDKADTFGADEPDKADTLGAGEPDAHAGDTAPPNNAWWARALRVLRFLLGAATLVGGLTWILVNLTGPSPALDLLVGAVLSAGGLVLLMPHRIRLPRLVTAVVTAGTAVAGTLAGLFAGAAQTCCSYVYFVDRGWPFSWAQRGAVAEDPDAAYRLAQDADWQIDLVSLTGNLLLWAYLGLLLVVIAVLVRRDRSAHREPLP